MMGYLYAKFESKISENEGAFELSTRSKILANWLRFF